MSLLLAAALALNASGPALLREPVWRDIDLIPAGWKLYDKTEGDLNGDGLTDSVLIIQQNDPDKIIENKDGLGSDHYDSNPRAVLVAFGSADNSYTLQAQDFAIIPTHDSPTISDPFEDAYIKDGLLHLDLAFFANAGSWSMFNRRFKFRWNGEAMALIGFDSVYVHRGSGEMRETSVNYLTGERIDGVGTIEDDVLESQSSEIAKGNRPLLGAIGNGFEFEGG